MKVIDITGTEKCGICGCYLAAKLRLEEEQCPDIPPKWKRIDKT